VSTIGPKVGILTLGCKVNQYESEAIAEGFAAHGATILPPSETCDIYVINTCTVTSESDRKSRQQIRRLIHQNPSAIVLVTGCLAQTSPGTLKVIRGVDCLIGNTRKMDVVSEGMKLWELRSKTDTPPCLIDDIDNAPFEPMTIQRFDRTRAYVKIEDGCENRCSYCIIPKARGKVRSKPMEDVLREVQSLTNSGCKEIVLTGIETASYGKDLENTDLASLLVKVDAIKGIGRVRLGSLDPSLITSRFISVISGLSSLTPHFHLSLHSGSNKILALMRRKYNAEQAMQNIIRLKAAIPHVTLTTDVIVGFPQETDEDFEQTVAFAKRAQFLMMHVFPYSERTGTPATNMDGSVDTAVRHERVRKLQAVAAEIRAELIKDKVRCTDACEVLFETFDNGMCMGHSADFFSFTVLSDTPLNGEIHTVKPLHHDGNVIHARLINKNDER